jgi:hypothetical protein
MTIYPLSPPKSLGRMTYTVCIIYIRRVGNAGDVGNLPKTFGRGERVYAWGRP